MTSTPKSRSLPPLAATLLAAFALASAGQEPTPGAAPEPLKIEGVENAFRLSPNLYSGGDPRGVEALTALKKLGVRTILSVDGVEPDVEAARRLGMRYVHLPIGYDGVPREQAVRMVQAVRTLPGPIYVHCHHGIHRGPAAAAVCAMASEGWSDERAADWLRLAGTSADYRGLYESVRDFAPPTAAELEAAGAELPERSEVPALVETMVKVDERWDALKAVQKAGFKPPAGRPDVDPTAEALQLLELYREASRLPDSKARGEAFLEQTAAAEALADELYRSMAAYAKQPSPEALDRLEASFAAAGKSCKSCHASHRDR
ncbi:cytochrome c [Paludisphaera soli]|uniref:cytochrome c n=1 Tax=Paludisphaera soli TaxID=2712865 RepID=UPI0013EA9BB0|nr:cytochrome c [Paludisphaera soli]